MAEFDFRGPVVLDTNTILNAVHNPQGLAAYSVRRLLMSKNDIIIPTYARDESIKIDRQNVLERPLAWQRAWLAVENFIGENGITLASTPDETRVEGINGADEPIVRVARDWGATLITDDASLIDETRLVGLKAVQPWAVARSYKGDGELEGLNTMSRFRPWDATGGYIFARVMAHGWPSMPHEHDHLVAALGPIRIGYRGKKHGWFVDYAGETSLFIDGAIEDKSQYLVAVNVIRIRNLTKLKLFVGKSTSWARSITKDFARYDNLKIDSLHIGGDGTDYGHWNGFFQDFVGGPGIIGKSFRAYSRSFDLAPNPFDDDTLRGQLRRNEFSINLKVNNRGNIIR